MLDTRLYPPTYRGKYSHMFPGDVAVWARFLDRFGEEYEGFYYDVMCGQAAKMFPRWQEPYHRDAYILSKLRIDALGVKDGSLDIIEVKPRGNMASIGQLLTYKEQYLKDYAPQKPIRMVLVCAEVDPNIVSLAEKSAIALYVMNQIDRKE